MPRVYIYIHTHIYMGNGAALERGARAWPNSRDLEPFSKDAACRGWLPPPSLSPSPLTARVLLDFRSPPLVCRTRALIFGCSVIIILYVGACAGLFFVMRIFVRGRVR